MKVLMKLNKRVPVYVILCNMASKKNAKPSIDWNDSLADFKDKVVKGAKNVPIVAQNLKYFNAAQKGPTAVAKTAAVDVTVNVAAAGAGRLLGAGLGAIRGKEMGKLAGDTAFEKLLPKTMSAGGTVFRTNTPMGPTLASTRIMTKGQQSAAEKGLTKIADNRANEIEASVRATVARATAKRTANVVKGTGVAGTVANKPKNKKAAEKKLETAKKAKQKGR
jgi:hypothetical protein